jgi:hypothetical protein
MVSFCAQTPSVAYGRNLKNVTVTRRKFFSRGMPIAEPMPIYFALIYSIFDLNSTL